MFPALLALTSIVSASELALYWGQNSAGTETSLADYCQNTPGDIYIISFINEFGSGRPMSMNIHGYYNYISGTQLLDAPTLGQDIQTCQQLGKKIFVSLGGSSGNYGFSSDADAEEVANDLWNFFGGGYSTTRPFGVDVKVDGFDLDSENSLSAPQYATLVNKLSELYSTDASKHYYTSAAPQCPFPDSSVGDAISNSHLDYLFVQFYNNYCSMTGSSFNFEQWQSFASSESPNRDVKIMAGLPGSSTAAGSGYATIEQIRAKFPELAASANFGGFSVWDASQANANVIDGESFAQQLQDLLHSSTVTSSTTSSLPTTTGVSGEPAFTTSTVPGVPVSSASSISVTGTSSISSTPGVPFTPYSDSSPVTPGTSISSYPSAPFTSTGGSDVPDSPDTSASTTGSTTNSAPSTLSVSTVNGTELATSYSTIIIGTYTSTVPRTTSIIPASYGGSYETVGEATVLLTYTSTVPWGSTITGVSTTFGTNTSATVHGEPKSTFALTSGFPPQTSALQTSISPNATWINSWNNRYITPTSAITSLTTGTENSASSATHTHSLDITTTVYETSTIRIQVTSTLHGQNNNISATSYSLTTTASGNAMNSNTTARTYTTSLDTY